MNRRSYNIFWFFNPQYNFRFKIDAPLSISEKMVIRKQIEDNWTQIAGNLENIMVFEHLHIPRFINNHYN